MIAETTNLETRVEQLEGAVVECSRMVRELLAKGQRPVCQVVTSPVSSAGATHVRNAVAQIRVLVSNFYEVKEVLLSGRGRPARLAWARHVCFYLARKYLVVTQNELGELFGGRDHGTVSNGIDDVQERMGFDLRARDEIRKLERETEMLLGIWEDYQI